MQLPQDPAIALEELQFQKKKKKDFHPHKNLYSQTGNEADVLPQVERLNCGSHSHATHTTGYHSAAKLAPRATMAASPEDCAEWKIADLPKFHTISFHSHNILEMTTL